MRKNTKRLQQSYATLHDVLHEASMSKDNPITASAGRFLKELSPALAHTMEKEAERPGIDLQTMLLGITTALASMFVGYCLAPNPQFAEELNRHFHKETNEMLQEALTTMLRLMKENPNENDH